MQLKNENTEEPENKKSEPPEEDETKEEFSK